MVAIIITKGANGKNFRHRLDSNPNPYESKPQKQIPKINAVELGKR
jgi:hypothetical protein